MSDKSSEKSEMSELAWASQRLQYDIAPTGSVKERIGRAARSLGWGFNRTRDVWYADPRVAIRPKELRRIEEVTGLGYARQELSGVEAMLERADALLEGQDADFHRPFLAALRAFAGALDRPGTEE